MEKTAIRNAIEMFLVKNDYNMLIYFLSSKKLHYSIDIQFISPSPNNK